MTEVGESKPKRGFLTSFSHSKPCMRLHLAQLLSDKRTSMLLPLEVMMRSVKKNHASIFITHVTTKFMFQAAQG